MWVVLLVGGPGFGTGSAPPADSVIVWPTVVAVSAPAAGSIIAWPNVAAWELFTHGLGVVAERSRRADAACAAHFARRQGPARQGASALVRPLEDA